VAELEAVIFDIGNVFVEWDPRNLYVNHFDDLKAMEHFLSHITTPAWNLEQDRGRLFADAVKMLSDEHPDFADKIQMFHSNWIQMLGAEISGTVEILNTLQSDGVPVYAITNFSAETWPIFCSRHAFTERFVDIIVSGHEKIIKPDAEIFELAIKRFGLVPERSIFIDDSLANVRGAEALKIKGHHFTDALSLEADLKSRGLLGG